MNVYDVSIDGTGWTVEAYNVLSAIRKAINAENLDRREENFYLIDADALRGDTIFVEIKMRKANTTMKELWVDDMTAEKLANDQNL